MFTKEILHAGHKTSFTVTRDHAGWDLREERDDAVVRQAHYSDWHRVERAIQMFERLTARQASQS
jgi:hypothetical protein